MEVDSVIYHQLHWHMGDIVCAVWGIPMTQPNQIELESDPDCKNCSLQEQLAELTKPSDKGDN